MSEKLSKEQEELVDRFSKVGIDKNVAAVLVYMAGKEETISKEIESATGLLQPEVSVAVNKLKEKDWVKMREIKKEGRGRPVYGYSLNVTTEDILSKTEERVKKRINDIESNLINIKKLLREIY